MNQCCENLENRAPGVGPRGGGLPRPKFVSTHPDLVSVPVKVSATHCTICKCRHFEADVDPIKLGITGKEAT